MGIRVENVSKSFNSRGCTVEPLRDVSLKIEKGEFVCLLGPSGCGKSTLLNMVAGLEKPSAGSIYLGDKKIETTGVERAMMFQDSALFPWLNVMENVEFGMIQAGVPEAERKERAEKYLKMVHLSKFKDSYIHEISGGMKQRVALARALSLDSEVLLMDEPFAALDSQTKSLLQQELQKIWWETKKTIVFVTHNVDEAVLLADRVVVMSANPGRIKRDIKVELSRPRKLDTADLAYVASEVMKVLKEEVEAVAKREFDNGWNIEDDSSVYSPYGDIGFGL